MTSQDVWNTYADDLNYFILSKIKDKTSADDVLQDTFLKIHTKLHTLKDVSKLKPWIFTIARNSIMDFYKSTNKVYDYQGYEIEHEDEFAAHTEQDCLRGILANLPSKYRKPLFLSDIKGMKQYEVAKELKQSLSTTKSQIQRARKLIAKGFMDCCGFVLNEEGKLVGEIQDKENCNICK